MVEGEGYGTLGHTVVQGHCTHRSGCSLGPQPELKAFLRHLLFHVYAPSLSPLRVHYTSVLSNLAAANTCTLWAQSKG